MTLMSLSQNKQEIKTNKQLLGGIMKGIGFFPGSDSGKSAGVYSRKPFLTPPQIEKDNNQWPKLHQYDKFVYSRITHFSKWAENENQSLMEAAKSPNFSQLEWTSANQKEEFKSFTNVIVTKDGFFNKPQQDLNNLNAWTYGIFSFVSKKSFPSPSNCLHPLWTWLALCQIENGDQFFKKNLASSKFFGRHQQWFIIQQNLLQKLLIMTK
ncbi:hypothetical protein O181_098743 [Austropuccinia psidii MF-1]|uniref:Tet-like 2OG-Fe(II) oxygenase domain-containing protein n=1 Tax=Austropuccinia psidii MF-1 TaxID=1389203 RepID=A0A9Q3J9T9_9BASI|nr:hypothetical protein [Austropuccinia psidii MF-1]